MTFFFSFPTSEQDCGELLGGGGLDLRQPGLGFRILCLDLSIMRFILRIFSYPVYLYVQKSGIKTTVLHSFVFFAPIRPDHVGLPMPTAFTCIDRSQCVKVLDRFDQYVIFFNACMIFQRLCPLQRGDRL